MTRAYERPSSLEAAIDRLADRPWTIIAGGTDVLPNETSLQAWGQPATDDLLDITAIEPLRAIETTADGTRVGALATWRDLIQLDLPECFDGLREAGREVGGAQIQNRATLAGNLCNASPAADGVPALLALDAAVELSGPTGARQLPLGDFILGNRKTARRADELMTAILIPPHAPGTRSTFLKLGARSYLVISIAMVAGVIEPDRSGRVTQARFAVGACSAVALRIPALETALQGAPIDSSLIAMLQPEMLDALAPIDDVRASADYRRDAALTLLRRALGELGASDQ
jgi:CO/xanthine dehydrogenase FAD-binding subunit